MLVPLEGKERFKRYARSEFAVLPDPPPAVNPPLNPFVCAGAGVFWPVPGEKYLVLSSEAPRPDWPLEHWTVRLKTLRDLPTPTYAEFDN